MAEQFGGKPRDDLEDSDFVLPKERKFPVMTRQDVRDAVSSWGRYKGETEFPEFKERLVALAKKKGLADALPEAWGATKAVPFDPFAAAEEPAIKAGARHSAADKAILKAMHGATQDYMKARGDAAGTFAAQMADYLKALGHEPDEPAPDDEEADPDAELDGEPALKAIDLATRAEMVCSAIIEALEELGGLEDDDLGDMAAYVRPVVAAAKCDEDEPEIYVYDDHAVACLPGGDWMIPYTFEGGAVVLSDPDEWQRVEVEWRPVEGAAPITEEATKAVGDAVKLTDDGQIEGYAVRFGAPDEPDISVMRDYFTKSTDFWIDAWDKRPMLYHHGLDPATKAAPRIGEWVAAGVDDVGVWLRGQLDKAHRYHEAVKELARRGLLRISSDSAPHLVMRAPQPNGTNEVKRWPMLAASLTVSAAEPRLLPVELKTLIDLLDTSPEADEPESARPDGAKADDGAARRLALELDLMEIEQ